MINWRKPIIFFLLYLSGSKIPRNLSEIKKIDRASLKEKMEFQKEKLNKILLHAYNNVPYYHKILDEVGVIKNNEVNLDNFNKIPILTKDIIRRENNNLYSKDYKKKKYYENTSGGSTGEPIKFIQDKNYNDWNIANKIFYKNFAYQRIGNKELRLWGSERDIIFGKEKISIRIRNFLYNRTEFNSFNMSLKNMRNFVVKWNKFKPTWVEAYVQPMHEFALFVEKNNLKIYSPNGILTSAGTLYPEMKKKIEKIFNCPVYNRYGSREVGDIACSDNTNLGLKLSFWNNFLQILDNKIYITNLNNYIMPFIKYEIGDIGVKNENWNYLEKIEGRETTVFKNKDGKIIPAEFFIHFIGVVYNKGFISKFQVIQENYNNFEIKVVVINKIDFEKERKNIENSIINVMEKKCKIKWTFVDNIPNLDNGKYLYTISKL